MATRRPLVLVTGVSSGSLELARECAHHGYDLVIAAEDDLVHEAAAPCAYTEPRCTLRAGERRVSTALLNAGIGHAGAFRETDPGDLARVIDVNASSTVHLARRLLADMAERGDDRLLIFTSSVAAETSGPCHAVYDASKAFLYSFAQAALHHEVQGTGVTVTALPPVRRTHGLLRAGLLGARPGRSKKDDPALVTRQGYRALMAGRSRTSGRLRTRSAQGALHPRAPGRCQNRPARPLARPHGSGSRTAEIVDAEGRAKAASSRGKGAGVDSERWQP
ncbi:SDR family NAD(P)-dependent oxidoreductase [Streptomyces avidinii]